MNTTDTNHFLPVAPVPVKVNEYENLIEAAEYAAALLGKIPAFGDSLGSEVNKPLLGVAHNKLVTALAQIHIKEPHP